MRENRKGGRLCGSNETIVHMMSGPHRVWELVYQYWCRWQVTQEWTGS